VINVALARGIFQPDCSIFHGSFKKVRIFAGKDDFTPFQNDCKLCVNAARLIWLLTAATFQSNPVQMTKLYRGHSQKQAGHGKKNARLNVQ
jgi:hypothetical protein